MDIILRDCGRVGWLGIIEQDGKELYRTGSHWPNPTAAYERVCRWLDDKE
jgi:hypothetical protein